MADKAIGDLLPVQEVGLTDLFVLEQNSVAKSLTGNTLKNWLLELAEGHGGIANIAYTDPVAPSLNGTITITLADDTTTNITLKNGRGISSISAPTHSGLVDTYTINFNDGSTQRYSVTNGAQGEAGQNWYVHIRYSSVQPSSDADMHDLPDDWIGFYSGTSSSAPAHYTSYAWYLMKGNQGDASTVTIGTVSTTQVAAGGQAWATVTNTSEDPTQGVFNFAFGIPSGHDGQGSGSVTSVGFTAGSGISLSGDNPITSNGSVTIGHSNSIVAKSTQALYPFSVDANGHITGTGTPATAASLGCIANPATKSANQVLTYNGSTWVAATPASAVSSVNGQIGAVTLNYSSVGAIRSDNSVLTCSIGTTSWTAQNEKQISVSGVRAASTLVVSPDPTSYAVWAAAKIRAISQSENTITFKCDSIPTESVTANILQIGG